mgnify:CR=1 FL=1
MSWLADHTVRHLGRVAALPEFGDERYSVVREVGRGGMGTVYLAHDNVLDRDVALKVSNAARPDPALEARVRTEALVLARLEHPGIVPIHDVGTLPDGRLFYIMKLVRGRTLEEYLSDRHDPIERLRVFERVCEPVAFAHARGVVHRDLKPGNIMVGSFGEVLVMDWGVAKVLAEPEREAPASAAAADGDTEPGTVLGTRGFMPPEQASGRVDLIDQRTDVFALGALLHWMLAARPPSENGPAPDGRQLRHVPRRLRAICTRALARNPEERYPSADELARDIARYQAGQPVFAYRETVLDRAGRLLSKYRIPILLILAYLVMRALVAWLAA